LPGFAGVNRASTKRNDDSLPIRLVELTLNSLNSSCWASRFFMAEAWIYANGFGGVYDEKRDSVLVPKQAVCLLGLLLRIGITDIHHRNGDVFSLS